MNRVEVQKMPIETALRPKVCSCGQVHTVAPAGAEIWESGTLPNGQEIMGGLFFDCTCKRSIFAKWTEVKTA